MYFKHADKQPNYLIALCSSLTAIIILTFIFSFMGITPFGNNNLTFSDIGAQYIPFLTDIKNQLLNHNFNFFSFKLGIGDNYLPLIAYYLLSPFNLIIFLFNDSQMPIAVAVIIIAKISAIAFTTSLLLTKIIALYHNHLKRSWVVNMMVIVMSIAFSMGGFVSSFFYNIMWLDSLIFLPLVLMGIINIIHDNRSLLYFCSLFMVIITNYYLGYMTCLFSVIFFAYWLYITKIHAQLPIKHYLKNILNFGISSLLAGAATAFLLVPTGISMMHTDKSGVSNSGFSSHLLFGIDIFKQFTIGVDGFNNRLVHMPSLFIGTLILVLAISFFFLNNISLKMKIATGATLTFLGLGLIYNPLNTVWHMFNQPAGFPYRNAYFVAFFLIIMAFLTILNFNSQFKIFMYSLPLVFVGFVITWILSPAASKSNILLNIGITILISIGVFIGSHQKNALPLIILILSFFTLYEIATNFKISISDAPFGSQQLYEETYQHTEKVLSNIPDKNQSRLQFDSPGIKASYTFDYNGYNDSLLFDFNGTSTYSSTLNEDSRQMMSGLGMFSRNARRYSYRGHTPFTRDILAVNQTLTEEEEYLPYETPFPTVWETSTKQPIKSLDESKPFDNHDHLINNMFGGSKDETYFVTPAINSNSNGLNLSMHKNGPVILFDYHDHLINNMFDGSKDETDFVTPAINSNSNGLNLSMHKNGPVILFDYHDHLINNMFGGTKDETDFATPAINSNSNGLNLSMRKNGPVILYMPHHAEKPTQIIINGEVRDTVPDSSYFINLGYFHKKDKINLQFSKIPQNFKYEVKQFDNGKYRKISQKARDQSGFYYQKDNQDGNLVIVVDVKDGNTLFTSIPFDESFSATENGKAIKVQKIYGNFIGFNLPKGKHKINLVFHPKGLKVGIIISSIALLMFLLFYFFTIIKFKNKNSP